MLFAKGLLGRRRTPSRFLGKPKLYGSTRLTGEGLESGLKKRTEKPKPEEQSESLYLPERTHHGGTTT